MSLPGDCTGQLQVELDVILGHSLPQHGCQLVPGAVRRTRPKAPLLDVSLKKVEDSGIILHCVNRTQQLCDTLVGRCAARVLRHLSRLVSTGVWPNLRASANNLNSVGLQRTRRATASVLSACS